MKDGTLTWKDIQGSSFQQLVGSLVGPSLSWNLESANRLSNGVGQSWKKINSKDKFLSETSNFKFPLS